jgi:hypothetical protein
METGRILYTDCTHLKSDANPWKTINEAHPEGVSEHFEQLNIAGGQTGKNTKKSRYPP